MTIELGIGALLALLAAASLSDLRRRRIPNALVVVGALIGLGLQAALPAGRGLFDASEPGGIGWSPALLASVVLLAAGMLLWRAGLFGAGDAKLLAAIGPYIGPAAVLPVLLYTLLAGGLLALAAQVARWIRPARANPLRLPYALAITGGTLMHALPGTFTRLQASFPSP